MKNTVKTLMLTLLLAACGTYTANDKAVWGYACPEVDNQLTSCQSLSGETGWCAVGFCRQACTTIEDENGNTKFSGCASNDMPTPTIDNECYCVPR